MAEDTGTGGDVTQPAYLSHGVRLDYEPITLALSRREGRPLSWAPSADAVAGGGQGSGIVECQARPWPGHGDEATRLRQRDVGCAQTWAAKTDVGRHRIRHGHMRDTVAIWGNHRNPAIVQRGNT